MSPVLGRWRQGILGYIVRLHKTLSKKKGYHTPDSTGICKVLSKPGTEKEKRGGAGWSRAEQGRSRGGAPALLVRTEPWSGCNRKG